MRTVKLAPEKSFTTIRSFNGKIFSAEFIKKDGTHRQMVCRMGVTKGIKGTGTYSHTKDITRSNITVFDFNKQAYRAIPLNRLISLKCGDVKYEVVK